jgi:exosortase/archaeosortase family protein
MQPHYLVAYGSSMLVAPTSVASSGRTALKQYGKPLLVAALVLYAYRNSLVTLVEGMRLDTPLAHLALVPLIALGLGFTARRWSAGPDIHDRQLDWIIGIVLCAGATLANVVLPGRLSTDYWTWRLDLLSLPFFVAGVICMAFGTRTLWKYRVAVLFLFLAWPYPYSVVLNRYLGRFTTLTVDALSWSLQHFPLASRVVGSESLFEVRFAGDPIRMSVASACSGANGLVGFLLVATAFVLVVNGSRLAKWSWLLAGAALVWVLNIVRILIIFWAAGRWGEDVAIDGFHPYTGLVVFNIAVAVMVCAMRLFGLRFAGPAGADGGGGSAVARQIVRQPSYAALVVVGLVAATVGVFNSNLRSYDRITSTFGSPRLSSFAASKETPDGWKLTYGDRFDWSKRFFGQDSSWNRYLYSSSSPDGELYSNVALIADVIDTSDRAALSNYGVEACYSFHNYRIGGQSSVDLGGGLRGDFLVWTNPKTEQTYTTLYWHWPVRQGSSTRYERFTLMLQDIETNEFSSPPLTTTSTRQLQLTLNDFLEGRADVTQQQRLVETQQFMVGFAREIVERRAAAPES